MNGCQETKKKNLEYVRSVSPPIGIAKNCSNGKVAMPNKPEIDEKIQQKQLMFEFEPLPNQMMSVDEIFEKADEVLLQQLAEDNRIERKPAKFAGDNLGEYFSMWANTPNGGLIVSGQRDKQGFDGLCSLTAEELNQRDKTAMVHCPDAKATFKKVEVKNLQGGRDFVYLIRVFYQPDMVVRTSKGKVFVRKGDSCIQLRPEEIRELEADKGQVSFERHKCDLEWPQDFKIEAASAFVMAVRNARKLAENLTVEEILAIRHLGVRKHGVFVPNIACALLFAKDPVAIIPGCKIHFQRFEGETEGTGEKYNVVKDQFVEGTVPDLIQQTALLLDSQLRTFTPLDHKMKFCPIPEYPKLAWYEAIVNACVHRSYGNGLRNMPIFVKMFDDKLVIESPGLFPPSVTPENIYESHHPRNPHMMDAMFYLEYVKCAHEGTRRIRDTMKEQSLPPPIFFQSSTGPAIVRVTLKNNVKQRRAWIDRDVSKIISEAIAADLTEEERRALNLAAMNQSITVSDANKALNIPWHRARKLLLELARKRIFQYIRFREFKKDSRDPKAFFRLRSSDPIPEGGFEASVEQMEDDR